MINYTRAPEILLHDRGLVITMCIRVEDELAGAWRGLYNELSSCFDLDTEATERGGLIEILFRLSKETNQPEAIEAFDLIQELLRQTEAALADPFSSRADYPMIASDSAAELWDRITTGLPWAVPVQSTSVAG